MCALSRTLIQYKDAFSRYGDFHCWDKRVMIHLYDGNSSTDKVASLYWNAPPPQTKLKKLQNFYKFEHWFIKKLTGLRSKDRPESLTLLVCGILYIPKIIQTFLVLFGCGLVPVNFTHTIGIISLPMGQSYDCPSTMMNVIKMIWVIFTGAIMQLPWWVFVLLCFQLLTVDIAHHFIKCSNKCFSYLHSLYLLTLPVDVNHEITYLYVGRNEVPVICVSDIQDVDEYKQNEDLQCKPYKLPGTPFTNMD